MKNDAPEKINLAKKRKYKAQKRQLKEKLKSWIDKNNVTVAPPSEEALKSQDELNERLKSLGYVR